MALQADKERATPNPSNRHSLIPDGGYGWVITIASFMCHFIADGIAYSFGVIYPDLLESFGESKSTTSWIGSIFFGIPLISGPVAGLFVTKYGCRPATLLGGIITSVGMLLSSFAGSIEVLTFTFGVVSGFGLAFIYVPASVIPAFWFEKRRSLATGIAVAGSGLGTFAIAPLTEYLLSEYGWRGTLLILSAVTLNFLVFGALFREVPTSNTVLPITRKLVSVDSLPSIISFQSFHEDRERSHESVQTSPSSPTTPLRKHHSTNTVFVADGLQLLPPPGVSSPAVSRPDVAHCTSVAHLLRSKHSLLPVSRHDITSVMTLALRQQACASCPDLSAAGEEEKGAEDDDEDDNCSQQGKKSKPAKRIVLKVCQLLAETCNVRLLAVPVYSLFFMSSFMLSYAYDLPYLYLPDYAATTGVTRPSFLIAIIGIVSTVGQILYGYLGDMKCVDTLLLYGVSIFFCGLSVTLVPVMTSPVVLVVFSVLFGFLISANFSLETVVLVKILSLDQLTKAYGLLMFGQGVASLIGPPIGGLLWDVTHTYVYTFLFAGLSIIVSSVLTISIVFVKKSSRSRSVSESTDIVPP